MLIGEVVGRLWASRQAETLGGQKLLLIRPLAAGSGTADDATAPTARLVVAVDGLDAGPGDRVIVAHGTRVRDITVGETVADKDVVVAVVDDLQLLRGRA
jgi:ethanolamine utilization protein EutN